MNGMKVASHDPAAAQRANPLAVAANGAAALARNIGCNLARWCGALARAPRARPPPLSQAAVLAVILTLVAVVASMFLVDSAAADWARGLPRWFTGVFERISNTGYSGWFLVPSAIGVLCLAAVTRPALPRSTQGVLGALAARFGFVFLAIGAPGLFTTIVKRLIGRARPYMDAHGDPFTYLPFAWRSEFASLPSGHATTVGAAAIALGALWPRARPLLWLYALVVMFARVVTLAHHPSDVIAGVLVGAVGAALVRRFFARRRLVFSARDLSVLPGPSLGRLSDAARRLVSVPRKVKNPEFPPD